MTMFQNTDIGNAERLDALHGMNLRYVPAWNRWLVWDGKRWAVDDMRRVRELARDTIRNIVNDALATADLDERNKVLTWAKRSESDAAIAAMLRAADTLPSFKIAPDALDAKPYLVSCANGTLDLRLGILQPHRREDYITKLIPIAYDANAKCERWLRWLLETFGGDCDLIDYVHRAVGYSLTGDTGEQVFFFAHGPAMGGKSTFLSVLAAIAGENAIAAAFDLLLEQRGGGPRNDIARLAGMRVVTAVEAGEGQKFNEPIVKQLTGRDTISARMLYREAFDFKPTFKLWIGANHKPVIKDSDNGIWRRVQMIPFVNVVPPERRIKDIEAVLLRDKEGIFAWAVAGVAAWLAVGGLKAPEAVTLATEEYRTESDILGQFIDEMCERGPGFSESATVLHGAYRKWWDDNGHRAFMNPTKFGRSLEERGFARVEGSGHHEPVRRVGLRLLPPGGASTANRGTVGDSTPPVAGTPHTRARAHTGLYANGPQLSPTVPRDDAEQLDIHHDRGAA